MKHTKFISTVKNFYKTHYRPMPWRETPSPYYVLVSELMLQQTQVQRVMTKFPPFIERFPTVEALANAELSEVLEEWDGLGYYRRPRFLHESAKIIINEFGGEIPQSVDELVKLHGVGPNTAAAVAVYAFNSPEIFIETNIRTVYIHHFFDDVSEIKDDELIPIITDTVDKKNPREWYWALMDYGTFIKATHGNLSRKSAHYKKQSAFKGSFRQKRAKTLKLIMKTPLTFDELQVATEFEKELLKEILQALSDDKMIIFENDIYQIL